MHIFGWNWGFFKFKSKIKCKNKYFDSRKLQFIWDTKWKFSTKFCQKQFFVWDKNQKRINRFFRFFKEKVLEKWFIQLSYKPFYYRQLFHLTIINTIFSSFSDNFHAVIYFYYFCPFNRPGLLVSFEINIRLLIS